jgi:DNA-binding IclR family transcriptional regulator
MAGNSAEAGRSVTSKITAILITFTEGQEHSLTQMARLVGLPVSTTHRLTSELAAQRLLERTDDGLYRAGLPLRMIGQTVKGQCPSLTERAPYVLEDLVAATGQRARLGVLRDVEVSYIEKQPGPRPATMFSPAATLPAPPTAMGRMLLAFAPPGTVERAIIRGLHAYTRHTVTAAGQFRRTLGVTRLTQVAISRDEFEAGVCAVAVPVFGPDRAVIAAIEIAVTDPHQAHRLHQCTLHRPQIIDQPAAGRTDPDLNPVLAALAIASRSLSRELTADHTNPVTRTHPRPPDSPGRSRHRRRSGTARRSLSARSDGGSRRDPARPSDHGETGLTIPEVVGEDTIANDDRIADASSLAHSRGNCLRLC